LIGVSSPYLAGRGGPVFFVNFLFPVFVPSVSPCSFPAPSHFFLGTLREAIRPLPSHLQPFPPPLVRMGAPGGQVTALPSLSWGACASLLSIGPWSPRLNPFPFVNQIQLRRFSTPPPPPPIACCSKIRHSLFWCVQSYAAFNRAPPLFSPF